MMEDIKKNLKQFVSQHSIWFFYYALFVLIIHFSQFFQPTIGIDTEDIIHNSDTFYNGWINTGRIGLVVTKFFMNHLQFQPIFAGLLVYVLFTIITYFYTQMLIYLLHLDIKPYLAILISLLISSHPIWTDQFYFSLQSVEICIAISLVLAFFVLFYYGVSNHQIKYVILGTPLLLFSMYFYQAIVVFSIYILGTFCFINTIIKLSSNSLCTFKELVRPLLYSGSVFLACFLINQFSVKLIWGDSAYLSNQIYWNKQSIGRCFYFIFRHMYAVFTGDLYIQYSFILGILCLLSLFQLIKFVRLKKFPIKNTVFLLILYVFVLLIPFYLDFVTGYQSPIRSQLELPFYTGFLFVINYFLYKKSDVAAHHNSKLSSFIKIFLAMVLIIGCYAEIQSTSIMLYSEQQRYQHDMTLANQMTLEIEKVSNGENYPVAIIGNKPFAGNKSHVEGEVIGYSIFSHDYDVKPKYYHSTRRILGFFGTLGKEFEILEADCFEYARQLAKDMPVWPYEGCIAVKEDIIIVHLSEETMDQED